MRNFLLLILPILLFVGCGSPNLDDPNTLDNIIAEAIDGGKLQERGKEGEELFYAQNTQTPFTGWAKFTHENGQIVGLSHYKDGKLDGLGTSWYENNGQKKFERNWKDGVRHGLCTHWEYDGQKNVETNYKDGKLDGLRTWWYKNGQKKTEENLKDEKIVTITTWKPNGEKCPITNVVDGNGVCVEYSEDGTEQWRSKYKDGVQVE